MIRNEVEHLCHLNILCQCNESKWAAPSFGTPKKYGQIQFISDFRQLNKWIIHQPYPMPSIHELFKCFEGFTYCTALDLGESTVTSAFQWDLPVHQMYTKRKCQNYSLTWSLSLFIRMTYLYLPPVHLTITYDNLEMSSNDSIATTFKSMPKIKLLCIGDGILRLHTYQRRYQTTTTKGQCNPWSCPALQRKASLILHWQAKSL